MSNNREQAAALGAASSEPSSLREADTERTVPLDSGPAPETPVPSSKPGADLARNRTTQVMGSFSPPTRATPDQSSQHVSIEYSAVQDKSPNTADAPAHRPAPAKELSLSTEPRLKGPRPNHEEGSHTTLQSMVRPDLLAHTIADPRRFLSIERELSELSAAIKFQEKRLHRAEKDSRVALALAALAVLLAVLGYLL